MGDQNITCSNPSCGQTIPYSSGEQFITCPACETWHMLDNDQAEAPAVDNSAYASPMESYMLPENEEEVACQLENDYANQEPAIDDYEPYAEMPPSPVAEILGSRLGDTPVIPDVYQGEHEETNEILSPQTSSLIAHLQTSTGERLVLKEGKNTIGRQGTDLIINDRTVSRRHCVVEVVQTEEDWNYFVCDISYLEGKASANGVFTGGRSVRLKDYERVQLYLNNSIQLGTISMVLKES